VAPIFMAHGVYTHRYLYVMLCKGPQRIGNDGIEVSDN